MSFRIALGIVAFVLVAGCVTSRSEVDVSVPQLNTGNAVANSNGKKVYISSLDERVFQINPRSADIPSLKNDEITDKSITSRAIARKRNSYGMGLGDVLLPSGRTLSALVNEAVSSAYKKAGYEIVTKPNDSNAVTVKVHIVEFWSWFSPGFFSVALNNKSHLKIETEGTQNLEVVTLKRESMQMVTEGDWTDITEAGLQEITQETLKQL